MNVAVCADVGSTYTKAAVVDLDDGGLVAAASAPTTVGTDVLHGLDAAVAAATAGLDAREVPWYVCSSAGGGLRLAVIGYEPLVTAQAGRRVGLSAGANVVHVAAGRLGQADLAALRAVRPDVVLLVGGTDGGDAEVLTHNATRLAKARWRVPVVLAGNVDVRDELSALLAAAGVPVTVADNVLPRIGVLAPVPARTAIREVFLRHVIGGKKLSRGGRFARLVRAATPDAVLTGVEVLADALGGDLAVVDVGGATTDVYSVLTPDERADGPSQEVAGTLWRARTVEGDLGMRWSAPGVVRAAAEERLLAPGERDGLAAAAAVRAADPAFLPADDADRAADRRIAALAATVALRRHARGAATGERAGRDLRDVKLVVGSGGVLRHADPADAAAVLEAVLTDHAGGWPLPRAARPVVDVDYVLAAAGLLAAEHPRAAVALLRRHLG
ncbi:MULTISPECIES: glutamate mutase L [Micromonospora]|uniref:Glutamate mutase n=1 Tax=Micromonospora solifontis TaxID=2487138 RepID=A0ABX9WHB5_9ACTN|nr:MULTISPECIES: glutamate mutase L [Micromonospora]NES13600.1 glutamate mutase [Micromonospora sp. PPF5-17B]NES37302.1 glutamate mutase [Micromonospora solifontis]NES55434.1 glutamate mutase [Micromonospora sp. PPF5-6]RNL98533.1 glutamate mutase [Micromonospora solifontis]